MLYKTSQHHFEKIPEELFKIFLSDMHIYYSTCIDQKLLIKSCFYLKDPDRPPHAAPCLVQHVDELSPSWVSNCPTRSLTSCVST